MSGRRRIVAPVRRRRRRAAGGRIGDRQTWMARRIIVHNLGVLAPIGLPGLPSEEGFRRHDCVIVLSLEKYS